MINHFRYFTHSWEIFIIHVAYSSSYRNNIIDFTHDISGNTRMTDDLLAIVPAHIRNKPRAVTRFLSQEHRPRRITCLFRSTQEHKYCRLPIYSFPAKPKVTEPLGERRHHPIYGITYFLQGRGTVTIARKTYSISPGSFILYNKERVDSGLPKPTHKTLCEFSLNFDQYTGQLLEQLGLWNFNERQIDAGINRVVTEQYVNIFENIIDVTKDACVLFGSICKLLEQVQEVRKLSGSDRSFKQQADTIMRQNLNPQFGIIQAAKRMNIPAETFRRKFTQAFGVPPGRYQLQLRMEHSKDLLAKHTVRHTAELLGYSDPYLFSRQFKTYFGVAPSCVQQ